MVGIEACGANHSWAGEIAKLEYEVRLNSPAYVQPFVQRGKSDGAKPWRIFWEYMLLAVRPSTG